MATLNQFQQYSQGENTVTNNVLLMFSNLYEISPKFYEDFIRGLTEDANSYEVVPRFNQQVNNQGNGFIDGHIQVKASKIIIETKLDGLETIDKLIKYSDSFESNEHKILLHLSKSRYSKDKMSEITDKLRSKKLEGNIFFHSLTYSDLVDNLNELAQNHLYDQYLQRLKEHFEAYCLNMGLMPRTHHLLRVMACGESFDINVKYQFYFDLASRGYREFNYLGIYKWKSVRYIGQVENMVMVEWNEKDGITNILEQQSELTEEQKDRLNRAIAESVKLGWNLHHGHRFFLLKNFTETDYRKISPGGIYRVRYFNIEENLGKSPGDIKQIAEKLKLFTWK